MTMHDTLDYERHYKAIELRLKGLTYQEIGEALGCSRQRAQQLVRPDTEIYEWVQRRANGKCEACGTALQSGHVHHKARTNEEDYNRLENLQYLCISCHQKVHVETKPIVPKYSFHATVAEAMRKHKGNRRWKDMAAELGFSPGALSRIYHGSKTPTKELLVTLGLSK